MAREELVEGSGNPTIHNSGSASFGKNHFCTWTTTNGSTSICTIQNTGLANSLVFAVSGAPSSIMTTEGQPFNGKFELPPNKPTMNVTAIGDFLGTTVTIFNLSPLDATCSVNVVVAK